MTTEEDARFQTMTILRMLIPVEEWPAWTAIEGERAGQRENWSDSPTRPLSEWSALLAKYLGRVSAETLTYDFWVAQGWGVLEAAGEEPLEMSRQELVIHQVREPLIALGALAVAMLTDLDKRIASIRRASEKGAPDAGDSTPGGARDGEVPLQPGH